MLSISNMNSEQASHYHANDQNYYQKDGSKGIWSGNGANLLGLSGEVDQEDFKRLCFGIHPREDKILVNTTKRAGTDLTFSAPKGVSLLMELSDHEEEMNIRKAHDEAVDKVLKLIEDNYLQMRLQTNGERVVIQTNNAVIAKFQHDTSRELDPQLHTHAFFLNMTTQDGETFRALHNEKLFANKMYLGQVYRNELARNLKKLGYSINITDSKKGLFDIAGIPNELSDHFSKRREKITQNVKELKAQYPNASESELYQIATLNTRKSKNKNINRETVRKENIEEAQKIVDIKTLLKNIKNQNQTKENIMPIEEIINKSAQILTQSESLFTKEQILKVSLQLALDKGYSNEELEKAFLENENFVHDKENDLYTTKEMLKIEKEIINDAITFQNIYQAVEKDQQKIQTFLDQYELKKGQRKAVEEILQNKDLIMNIQGDAGTGKTYMLQVANDYIKAQKSPKYTLQGLAFTGKASAEIEKSANIPSTTLHGFLNQTKFEKNQIYIVDEASMIGSKQMKQLKDIAQQNDSKIVLIGDTKQFQGLQAGAIFEELQKVDSVKTVVMDESLRAKNELMKSLYENIKNQQLEKAFQTLENNQLIVENENQNELMQNIKNEYIEKAYLKNEDTLLIVANNNQRRELNEQIRAELKNLNEENKLFEMIKDEIKDIGKEFLTDGIVLKIKETVNLDEVSKHFAINYDVGNLVFINKAFEGVKAGTQFKIANVNTKDNTIDLLSSENKILTVDLNKYGDKLSMFKEFEKEFAINEKITFTKNDKFFGVKNGDVGIIESIKENFLNVKVGEKNIEIDVEKYNYFDYGYAISQMKSQGQTTSNLLALVSPEAQSLNALYTQITRAKDFAKLFTSDKESMIERSQNKQNKTITLNMTKSETNEFEMEM